MPDQPIEGSSGLAVPLRPKMFTIEVVQRAISYMVFCDICALSAMLYAEINSDMVFMTEGVLKESQSAS